MSSSNGGQTGMNTLKKADFSSSSMVTVFQFPQVLPPIELSIFNGIFVLIFLICLLVCLEPLNLSLSIMCSMCSIG